MRRIWVVAGVWAALAAAGGAAAGADRAEAASAGGAAGVEPVAAGAAEDPCRGEVVSQPARPMWTAGAQTTQCGVMENDLGWRWMGLGGGVAQRGLTSAERYGITRRLDVTVSLPLRLVESGGDEATEGGISDQSVSAMYEFHAQGRRTPAMAVSYGIKVPTANPAKGFGTGYADHQMVFLASRDVGRLHFDCNAVQIFAGAPEGHDEATQAGLVMAVPVAGVRGLSWLLESDGGSQPGTADRFGQGLTGVSWAVRPWLVVDTAYARAYTAGSPRQQFTMGVTWAHRVQWRRAGDGLARLLGQ